MAFLVQFGINLHSRVFQKSQIIIALAEAASAIWEFWKTRLCKLIQIELEPIWLPTCIISIILIIIDLH